jgi:hypothetical protein
MAIRPSSQEDGKNPPMPPCPRPRLRTTSLTFNSPHRWTLIPPPPAQEQRPDASPETDTDTDESVFEQRAPRFGRRARPTVFVCLARSLPDYLLLPHMLVARQREYEERRACEAEERRQRREAARERLKRRGERKTLVRRGRTSFLRFLVVNRVHGKDPLVHGEDLLVHGKVVTTPVVGVTMVVT